MRKLYPLMLALTLAACSKEDADHPATPDVETGAMNITAEVLNDSYTGNGPQWGGYDVLPDWIGANTLSDADWQTLFKRLSFMRPGFMRIMVSPGWNYMNGERFEPQKSEPVLCKMLEWCNQNGVTVQLGEWGHVGGSNVDELWVEQSVAFLDYLVNEKGFSCIRYYTVVNEPNGNWSSTNGSYPLWKNIIRRFHARLKQTGLTEKVTVMGPDVAVWTTDETAWVSNTRHELAQEVGAFDIHTYPSQDDVYSTGFRNLLQAYKAAADPGKVMLLGELGFKYPANSPLGMANANRIRNDKYAADDSQMHVYDSFYAIDMADATIQVMQSGMGGVTYWDLDDAMYNHDGSSNSTKLKRWGYWNILGAERFENPDDELIRPWFYTTSLLCRYFPAGTKTLRVQAPQPVKSGLRAIAGKRDGKFSLAVVNASASDYVFPLQMQQGERLSGLKRYRFSSLSGASFRGAVDSDGFALPEETGVVLDFSAGKMVEVRIPAKSFLLYTDMP